MIDAPQVPQTLLSPNRDWLMLLERPALPPVAELAQPEIRLAGIRINPRNSNQSRAGLATGIKLIKIADRFEKPINGVGQGARVGDAQWSPDGKRIAFSLVKDNAIELFVAEIANGGIAKRLTDRALNNAIGKAFVWQSDSKSLVANFVPLGRGAPPKLVDLPVGPLIMENLGKRNTERTHQDLLKSQYDEALFDYYGMSELAGIGLDGRITLIAQGVIRAFQPSPNGEYVMVQTIRRPYSYSVPISRFPLKTEIRDARDEDVGKVLKTLSDLAVAENEELDPDAVRKGPRQYAWRSDVPATITWVQPVEGRRNGLGDQLLALAAPFEGEPQTLAKVDLRYQTAFWGRDDVALVVEASRKTRRTVTWRIFPADSTRAPVKLFDRSSEDRYGDPGIPATEADSRGGRTLNFSPDGKAIYLIGNGASPEGDRPFIARYDLETRETKHLYRSEAPYYDTPIALFDSGPTLKLLLQRESVTEAPNIHFRDLTTGAMQAVTRFVTPKNPIALVTKEVIRYKRKDGVELSGTLYLPVGYKKDEGPLPLLIWAYPREFRSAEAAGQVSGSSYRYVRPSFSGPLPFLTLGYAVLDNPVMPIVGDNGKEPNDTYLPQLIASAEAAIDEVVRRGVADRSRIAVGGHSYGAFMVANLLAHTKLFAAGIAESGAYNRTLTPFGFQAEDRTFWRARDVYSQMSPFNFADQIKAPMLMIHGEADSNTGTFPLQSERLYQAIRGLGGTVRLVMLPHEDHGYRGRESVLHRLWESQRWLDKYVKNAGKAG
ncbi:MAG: prolyl oligopeptidase family serine peptidase [Burkholderiales bacterium]|nr:prolyl oligopeptidase family serine peptidase [Burkholderiales bacterium]